ncbi:hypothetical protein LIER_39263 [Lithospermum erythrorhizon]|uniref:Uncharacterized protein n=1 Tax=Lithospermum erythrorhizon TaxID=34254 RepID=A0AAV3QBW9_LITER
MSSSQVYEDPITRGKKHELCEEDEKPFENPSIEFTHINLRCLEDLAQSQRKSLKDRTPLPCPTHFEILRRGAVEVSRSQQHASNKRKQPSDGHFALDATRIGGSMHIPDFRPLHRYYGVVQEGKGETKTYKFEASFGDAYKISKKPGGKDVAKKKIKRPQCTRVVEITDEVINRDDVVLK